MAHYALFVGEDLDGGHSRMSATYDNPPLLGAGLGGNRFELDALEVWAADAAALAEAEEAAARAARRAESGSALDRYAHDRSFLSLTTGRGGASEGLRDEAP